MSTPRLESSTSSKAAFLLALTLISTLPGYFIGHDNQIEQLPGIMAMMEDGYLENDFFTQSSVEYGPRYFYYQLVAQLGSLITLPVAVLLLLLAGNGLGFWVTWQAAEYLLPSRKSAPYFACCAVVPFYSAHFLVPGVLAWPLAIAALLFGLQRRPLSAAIVGVIATMLQPVLAFPIAGLALLLSAIGCVLDCRSDREKLPSLWKSAFRHALAAAILIGITAVAWVLPVKKSLESAEFIHILAVYRHPHHYLFSHFSSWYFFNLACLIIALITAIAVYGRIAKTSNGSITCVQLWTLTCSIVFLLILGYVFVEVIPTRLVTTLQTERMTLLLFWCVSLLLGLIASDCVERESSIASWIAAVALIVACYSASMFMLSGLAVAIAFYSVAADDSRSKVRLVLGLVACCLLLGSLAFTPLELLPRLLATLALLAYWVFVASRAGSVASWAFPVGFAAAMVALYFVGQKPGIPYPVFATAPKFFFSDRLLNDPYRDNFEYARQQTAEDAVFIVPPGGGRMRIIGQRAIVVDFKAFPFQDDTIREWYDRSREFYGDDVETDRSRNAFYDGLSDEQLAEFAKKYDADYAVLSNEKPTELKEVFRGKSHKTVAFDR